VHHRQCSIVGSFLLIMSTVVLVNWLIGEMGLDIQSLSFTL
jgi:hypothetical protein